MKRSGWRGGRRGGHGGYGGIAQSTSCSLKVSEQLSIRLVENSVKQFKCENDPKCETISYHMPGLKAV